MRETLRAGALCGLLAGLALAALELVLLEGRAARGGLAVVGLLTAAGVVLGVAAAGLGAAAGAASARLFAVRHRRLGAATLALVVAAPACALLARTTLAGPWISARVPLALSVPLVAALGGAAAAGAAVGLTALAARGRAARRAGAALLAGLGALALAADARAYRRLYPAAHDAAGLVAALALLAAAALARAHRAPGLAGRRGVALAAGAALAGALATSAALAGSAGTRFFVIDRTAVAGRLLSLLPMPAPRAGGAGATGRIGAPRRRDEGAAAALRDAHLVLVTIDALRDDRIDAERAGRPLMPTLQRLAARALRFRRTYAQAPHSSFSIGSLLTSEYLHAALALRPTPPPTLAQVVRAHGMRTVAYYTPGIFFTGGELLSPLARSRFGFEEVVDTTDQDAARLTDALVTLLGDLRRGGEPRTFLWAHYFDVHEPYDRRPAFPFGDAPRDRYDAEAAFVDRELGRLVEALAGLRRPVVLVVTADHGEEFKEHGGDYHGSSVYEEQVRVPLLLVAPGVAAGDLAAPPVELVDVAPTVLGLLGIEPPPSMRGDDLLELARHPATAPPAFAEVDAKKMVVAGTLKLIHDLKHATWELYDLAVDPAERDNAYDRTPARAAELRGELARWADDLAARAASADAPAPILLGRIGDQRAVPALAALLGEEARPPALRREAAALLGRLNDRAAEPALHAAARGHDGAVATEAAIALGELGDRAARELLVDLALPSRDRAIRARAAIALARLDDPRAAPALVETIDGDDPQLRYRAIHYAGQLRAVAAVPALMRAAPDLRVRYLAAVALARIAAQTHDPRVLPFLIDLLARETYTDIRGFEVLALGLLGDPAAIPSVAPLLGSAPELTTVGETLVRLGALDHGALGGVDFAPERRGLGEGFGACRRELRESTDHYLGATTCDLEAPLGRVALSSPTGADGQLVIRFRPRDPGLAGGTLQLTLNGVALAPAPIVAGWQERRVATLGRLRAGRNALELSAVAPAGGATVGAPRAPRAGEARLELDHVLVAPARHP